MAPSPPILLAHRGFRGAGRPDNTLPAIVAARGVADGVEVDVRETADGVLVLSHDPILFGVSVAAAAYSELVAACRARGHPLTTLQQAVEALAPSAWLDAEVKVAGLGEAVFAAAHPTFGSRLRVSSFSPAFLEGVPPEFRWAISMLLPGPGEPIETAGLVAPCAAYLAAATRDRAPHRELAAWQVTSVAEADELLGLGVRFLIVDHPEAFVTRM